MGSGTEAKCYRVAFAAIQIVLGQSLVVKTYPKCRRAERCFGTWRPRRSWRPALRHVALTINFDVNWLAESEACVVWNASENSPAAAQPYMGSRMTYQVSIL
jgi:hypothetical protein